MATDSSDPIVIGSDDESDNDDVVLIKEEIEVDSEDVIFLSETKATPKTEIETSDRELTSSESKPSLSSNGSLTTVTGQLSLDDSNDTDILDDLLANTPPAAATPLDLSSKPLSSDSDLTDTDVDNVNMIPVPSGVPNQESSYMTLLTGPMPLMQTSDDVKADTNTKCPMQNIVKGALSGVCDPDRDQGGSRGVDDDNSSSDDQTDALTMQICDNSKSNNTSALTNSDWPAINLSPSRRTTSANHDTSDISCGPSVDAAALGCAGDTIKDKDNSVIVNTGPKMPGLSSQTVSGCIKSEDTANGSVITSNKDQSNVSPQLTATCQSSKDTSFRDLNTKSVHIDSNNQQSVNHTHNPQSVAIVTHDAHNPKSVAMGTKGNSADISDPFQKSHALLAALDVNLNSNSQSQTGSSSQGQSTSNSDTQSNCLMQVVHSSGLVTNLTNGLLGGSAQCIQPSSSYPTSDLSKSNDPSLTSGSIKRSLSMLESETPYYNALTLRLSQHDKSFKRSLSTSAFGSLGNATDFSSQSTRSTSPQNQRLGLPPKKQRRCYSDAVRDYNCINCESNLIGQKSSQCPNGHTTCTKCLEERVKLVLTGRAKESVKCLNQSCDSYYPISELRQSLPAMVVEILEDKLDQDYVNYISDMIMKQASEEIDEENASDELDQTDEGRFLKKYEDCPGNWEPMDERDVNRDGYVLVPLETESSDYQTVILRFFDSMVDHNVEVTAVHRVQNPIQWKYYSVKKSEMFRDSGGFYSVVEDQLFHGTNSSSVEAICRKGFDWRLCGKHGTVYGQGSYFAVNASYSHQYTDLRRPHGTLRSSMSYATSLPSMSLAGQSLIFPPKNVNFSTPSHSVTSHIGAPVAPSVQFIPMNLSHTATPSQPIGGSVTQTGLHTQTPSGSQTLSNSTHAGSSQISCSTTGSSANLTQPGPSRTASCYMRKKHAVHAMKKHHHCSLLQKLLPKPVAVRSTPTQTASSCSFGSNLATQPEAERIKAKVFFARVLVGKYTVGNPKLRKPPPLYPDSDKYGKCYDSCVDNESNPKIFVIFDSAQAYPEFMLEYTYSSDKHF